MGNQASSDMPAGAAPQEEVKAAVMVETPRGSADQAPGLRAARAEELAAEAANLDRPSAELATGFEHRPSAR